MVIRISAVLLAAGLSQRMGGDKLLLEYNSKSFLQHAVELLSMLDVDQRILVTTDARAVTLSLSPEIRVCINHTPEVGKGSSIKIGVEATVGTHYLFLTADQPKLKKEDIQPMLEAAQIHPDKIIHPVINSTPVSPTVFPARFRNELLSLYDKSIREQKDFGGQVIRDANNHLCFTVEPKNPLRFTDIDTLEDFKNLK